MNVGKSGWLPATAAGLAAGYVEGCQFKYGGQTVEAAVMSTGPVVLIGLCCCGSKEGAENTARRLLTSGVGPMDKDCTINFKELFS